MTWQKVSPESPKNAFESAMFPIEAGVKYRGLALLPFDSSRVPETQRDDVPLLALNVLNGYGVPSGVYFTMAARPNDWPQEFAEPVDPRYKPMYFELYAVRSGVLRTATPMVGNSVVMYVVELWKEIGATAPAPAPKPTPVPAPLPTRPAPAPGPAPSPAPTPASQPATAGGSVPGWFWLGAGAVGVGTLIWWLRRRPGGLALAGRTR